MYGGMSKLVSSHQPITLVGPTLKKNTYELWPRPEPLKFLFHDYGDLIGGWMEWMGDTGKTVPAKQRTTCLPLTLSISLFRVHVLLSDQMCSYSAGLGYKAFWIVWLLLRECGTTKGKEVG